MSEWGYGSVLLNAKPAMERAARDAAELSRLRALNAELLEALENDALWVPLNSLMADVDYLAGRFRTASAEEERLLKQSIKDRLAEVDNAIRAAIAKARLAPPTETGE